MFRPIFLAMMCVASARGASPCANGLLEMSVEGVAGVFCVGGPRICIANIGDGRCPLAQPGLPNGSFCGIVRTGVYGCKTNTTPAPPVTTRPPGTGPIAGTVSISEPPTTHCPGGYEVSVEGVPGIYCVDKGPVCIADISTGACPGVQPGLPYGSSCGRVASGVFGCKVITSVPSSSPTSSPPSAPVATPTATSAGSGRCPPGNAEMSVEGVQGVFCLASGPICMGDHSAGSCPGPQSGLLNGSYCGKVASGVYGCKPGAGPGFNPQDIIGTQAPTTAPTTTPGVTSITPVPSRTDGSQCKNGEYEMSVEGVRGIFCLSKGPICMADVSSGACPGPQFGLPNGSNCGKVASGVYGCKPNGVTASPSVVPTAAPTATPTSTPTSRPAPAPAGPDGVCSKGATPMSIEGVRTIFCVDEPACVQQRSNGDCPGAQNGLPYGSFCGLIARTGVYGCKPITSPPSVSR